MKILLFTLIITTLLITNSHSGPLDRQPKVQDARYTNKYDLYFIKYTKQYFGNGFNWQWFKAQSIAESNLAQDATSPVGARGLMQVMPATFGEIQDKLPHLLSIQEPKWNISAGLYYNHKLYRQWSAPRPFEDRMAFMLASYNGGLGNPLKCQELCTKLTGKACNEWEDIKPFANYIYTWRYKESLHYVDKIMKIMNTTYEEE